MSSREIKVYRNLMGANDEWAKKSRTLLSEKQLCMINLIGSPGSGKTALLEATAAICKDELRFAVLEGDVETTKDAERMTAAGVLSYQLLTKGSGTCHLSAKMVYEAMNDLPLNELDLVVVENVGNLICPAEFDIGDLAKIAVLSVTEGEEKPLKYSALFREASAVVLTKIDLLPYVPFSIETCIANIIKINPDIPIFQIHSLKREGLEPWIAWLQQKVIDAKKGSN